MKDIYNNTVNGEWTNGEEKIMGITKDITLDSAVTATYHKIDSMPDFIWDDYGEGKVQLAISQYISLEAREAGASPINKMFKTFNIDKDLAGILRFILYKAVLPIAPEFENALTAQDGELGNMLRLLKYLEPAEMSVMIFALHDILALMGINPELYRDWYNTLKEDTLSVIG